MVGGDPRRRHCAAVTLQMGSTCCAEAKREQGPAHANEQ